MTSLRPILVAIVGPTGSGKSDFAVRLARHIGGVPILSSDSRQVYRGMRIGTAQPTAAQLNAVPHYFIADREPTERFTCADFEHEALALLDKLFEHRRRDHPERPPVAIAVGGSGLYIDALCYGLDPMPDIDPELRNMLNDRIKKEGLEPLLQLLAKLDPGGFEMIDRRNPARVLRALEVCLQTGRPASEQRRAASLQAVTDTDRMSDETRKPGAKTAKRNFDTIKICIDIPRPELYARIDARVDAMLAEGLESEARALYPLRHLPALRTVGYSEMFDHFDRLYVDSAGNPLPENESLARATELIKRNSRRYAKRQMTWFRRDPEIRRTDPTTSGITSADFEDLVVELLPEICDRLPK